MSNETIFSDNFSSLLNTGWSWLREKSGHWRLADNGLEIRVEPGKADTVLNAFLRQAPDRSTGTFAIEVTVSNHTHPAEQYEQVGITWYCGDEPVFKLVKELIDGDVYIIPGKCPVPDQPIRLRLVVTTNSWEAQYKVGNDGEFVTAEKGELPAPDDDQISLQCYNGPENAEHWMRFADFSIAKLD
ncbi:MAG: hypothetical protein ACI8PG_001443 [Planctomycetota bacterium]|jgi:hypothetical protein